MTLEGLEIVRLIAEGGMGAVYEAKDPVLRRRVALKRLRPELRGDLESKAQFLKEARIVASLRHANIVEIYSVLDSPDDLLLVFEYIEGMTVAEMIASGGKLDLKECARVLRQTCAALDYAHAKRVLHRDLKPSNIMLDWRGMVKVMDFGIARQAKATITKLSGKDVSGTLSYMSPEQHLGEERTSADLYALGVSLYQMLTGAVPFKGPERDYLRQKESMEYAALTRALPGLPPGADAFMNKCLAADPKTRFATAAKLLAAYEEVFPA